MDAEVIVVGAGPVGLMLAAELRLAGVEPLVLERLAEPSRQRRARGIGPLAAEALRRRGLGDRLVAHHPERSGEKTREHGSELDHFAWIHKIDPLRQREPDRRGVLIWQPELEAVLGEHAARLGVEVRREHTVSELAQDAGGVTLTVETPDGVSQLRTAYLVGCDGGRSTVRRLAGFDFPGTLPTMTARQARARVSSPAELPVSGRTPTGMFLHAPGIIGTFDFDEPDAVSEGPVTSAELEASVRRVAGVDVIVTDLSDGLRFTDNARQVTTYRSNRVLLAGDAAHVHSPNGGQGLNLGLMDAVNLGWKLAAEFRGHAPEGLLDTYTAERYAVGAAVLHNTRAQSALLRPGPHVDALRDIISDLMDIEEANQYFGRMLSGLSARYTYSYSSPHSHPLLGCQLPDLKVAAAGKMIDLTDLTTAGRMLLLGASNSPVVATAASWRERIDIVEIDRMDHDDLTGVLIRPDGAVAWAAAADQAPDLAELEIALTSWLGEPRILGRDKLSS
jgi:2-polyprenyl-6-methoxyphenol hydroxylase-like FAD-dependent oxidoreductase